MPELRKQSINRDNILAHDEKLLLNDVSIIGLARKK